MDQTVAPEGQWRTRPACPRRHRQGTGRHTNDNTFDDRENDYDQLIYEIGRRGGGSSRRAARLEYPQWPAQRGVAWGAIPDHIKAIDTFMFRLTIGVHGKDGTKATDKHGGQFTFYLSEQYGFRMDIGGDGTTVSWYVPPQSDTITMVVPADKKVVQIAVAAGAARQDARAVRRPRRVHPAFPGSPIARNWAAPSSTASKSRGSK